MSIINPLGTLPENAVKCSVFLHIMQVLRNICDITVNLRSEPKITILDWLVKCPTILNFAWTYNKFGWTQFFRKMHSIAHVILVTYKLTQVINTYIYLLVNFYYDS